MERVRELAPFVKEALQKTAGVAKAFCFLHVTNTYLCSVVTLWGPSMLPTFNHLSVALAERISTRLGKVGSGDVVIIRSPEDPTKVVTKRIKAVEGDVVSFVMDPNNSDQLNTVVVPKGHVWVEGDNMQDSRDSRQFGAVPYAHVQSRVFFVVWPPKDFKLIGNKVL
ncbi:Peptidase S24/S26A/S26B/S26C family protein [Perilla frutescens var. hirtella]|nr:Peptidase S24/S26A/S26B/S26C family protein [Perilla frutescens var. frutescens]KAH6793077.1 Peptidase S24/S26A/S26B/S26C family protein [Perilla frutescens var. hirtella]